MGNTQANCHRQRPHSTLLQRQIKIYQWRADHKQHNIPSIEFKIENTVKQQQLLKKYTSQSTSKQYMLIGQLRAELQAMENKQEQIITFEKYACKLDELKGCLRREEAVYTLVSLLNAYEQLKKIYTKMPVNSSCCFVNLKGEVKGWVNSNHKSNQIETNILYNQYEERQYKQIIEEILKMAEQLAIHDMSLEYVIGHLRSTLKNITVRNDMFQVVRQELIAYCHRHGIQIANNLSGVLRRKQLSILKFKRNGSCKDSENRQTSTGSLQTFQHQSNRNSNEKNRPPSPHASGLVSFGYLNQTHMSKQSLNQHNMSHIVRPSLPVNNSSYIETPPQTARSYNQNKKYFKASQVLPSTPKPLIRSQSNKSREVKSARESKSSYQHSNNDIFDVSQGTLLEGKLLTSKELTNKMSISVAVRNHNRTSSGHSTKGVTRQISILQLEQDNNKQNRAKMHFHTTRDLPSNSSIHDHPRAWITSKTIDRLITSSPDNDSLVHSVGTSEDKIQYEQYSGALSELGREVSMCKKIKVKFMECQHA